MPALPRRTPLALALSALLIAAPGYAAEPPPVGSDGAGHAHDPVDLDTVQVRATALPGTADDLVRPVEVLAGSRLDDTKAASLGETVNSLPGVQSSYFGPGVGRPIIRGFDGARVQVLSDGLGTGDVSTVSVDHAVSVEPFLATQIEVLKGPATLLYGAGAIGGAVNVIDGRVPEHATGEPLEGRAELRAGTVNDERTGMLRLDGTSASGKLVFHFDALHRESGDYRIPGHAESARLLVAEGETPHPDAAGTLANSALRTDSAALGLSWVGERGFVGVGHSLFNTRYGVPGHVHADDGHDDDGHGHEEHPGHDHDHDHDHDHEAHAVRVVMDQRRDELRAGLDRVGPFESLRLKLARTAYTHTEYEGAAVGTVFDNDSIEGRLELVHRPLLGWDGAIGLQWSDRDFLAVGTEAFVPGSRSSDAGLFWVGQRGFGPLTAELGARHDRNGIDVDEGAIGADRDFNTTSLSAALRWDLDEDLHLSLGVDRAQRSPVSEELYSSGYHVATGALEIGSPGLEVETANRVEAGMHWHHGPFRLGASLYHVRYDDFIYLADSGVDDGGPVRLWTQADARFDGGEVEFDWTMADNASGSWDLRLFADAVRARLDGDGERTIDFAVPHGDHAHHHSARIALEGNLPRIAPRRAGATLRWAHGPWRASLGAVHHASQDDVAAYESASDGYTLVDAHLAWHVDTRGGNGVELFLDGSNLLDEEARPHTSFLRDLSPLPGRGVSFGVRAFF